MKKFIIVSSIIVISLAFLSGILEMKDMESTYEGIGNTIAENTVEKTGAINAVTATVFDFRGYDTLGESFVLFTAICGVAVVLRRNNKKGDVSDEG